MQPVMRPRTTFALLAALLAFAATGAALAAKPRRGAHLAGKTAQGRTISFDISATGKRVVHPIFYLQTHCFGGGTSYAQTSARSTATATGAIKRGRFHLRFTEHAKIKGGVTAKATFTLRGRFGSRKKATGTASVTVHYSDRAECLSGAVDYKVKT